MISKELNFNFIFNLLLFFTCIILSSFFLYYGYNKLKNFDVVNNIKLNDVKEDINLTKQIKSKYDQQFIEESNQQIIDNKNSQFITPKNIVVITVKKNDTFSKLIDVYIPDNKAKQEIIELINSYFNLKKINIGQKIYLYYYNDDPTNKISKIIIPLDFKTDLVLKIHIDSTYSIKKEVLPVTIDLISQEFTINSSIYKDGVNNNIPLEILLKIIKLYSFDVDFQRDIQVGNKLDVLYEIIFNENRNTNNYGKIKYIKLKLQKNNLEYFIFKTSEDYWEYFNREGKNVKKALMKTPIDGARLSSSFGVRKHPILGYSKIHKGVDFAAPIGTPIFAAGNGVIEYSGRNGNYGKYIRIRHNNSYKTAYAHLNSIKKGITKGIRVNQGEVIGYLGSTGRSTGPHLHYEVIYQNKQINPMTLKLPSGKILKEKELEEFIKSSQAIYAEFLFNLTE